MAKDAVREGLDAVRELLRMFRFERILYALSSTVSFALLIYVGYLFFTQQKIELNSITLFFGASSASTLASTRIVFFFNRSFNLIDFLVRQRVAKAAGE